MKRRPLLALPALLARPALAQAAWPSRPVRVVSPFAAGSSADLLARIYATHFQARFGQAFVVENLPGGSGVIGAGAVRNAPADGHTLMLASASTLAANPFLFRSLPYDAARDFRLAGLFGHAGLYLMVRGDGPDVSLDALLGRARAEPRQLNGGWFNASSRICLALLNEQAGVGFEAVPYRQIGATLADLMGGRLDLAFIDTLAGEQHVQSGQLRPLGVSTPQRLPNQPDVPALLERFPDFEVTGFLGFAVRTGTPEGALQAIHRATDEASADPSVGERLVQMGLTRLAIPLEDMSPYMERERERWGRHIRIARIEPE